MNQRQLLKDFENWFWSLSSQDGEGGTNGVMAVSFVSQNIDEIGEFGDKGIIKGMIDLLQLYNQRVDAVERDKSLLIEIPTSLSKFGNG